MDAEKWEAGKASMTSSRRDGGGEHGDHEDGGEHRGHDDDRRLDLSMFDFFSIPNALFRFLTPASVPASCSFDIRWSGPVTDRSRVNDPAVGFSGEFVLSQATMSWSAARPDGFRFESNRSGTKSAFAQLGEMRNGVFFGH